MKKRLLFLLFFVSTFTFYAQIQSYYDGLDLSKTGNDLFLELSGRLIDTHSAIPYTGSPVDVWDACRAADEDPNNSANVLLIYGYDDADGNFSTDRTRAKTENAGSQYITGKWNREHVFAKSLAIPSFGTDEPGPGTDVHNLRPADQDRNSDRGNNKFTDGTGIASYKSGINGGWFPGDEWKGDVARIIMYMYTRYHGDGSNTSETTCLPVNVGFGTTLTVDPNMIDLFLKWNVEDPVSSFEENRNEVLFGIQGNRNPYIDNPYLATVIWGGLVAEDKWEMNNSSDAEAPTAPSNVTAASITFESFELSWNPSSDNVGVYDYLIYVNGNYVKSTSETSAMLSNLSGNTTYQITIKARDAASNYSPLSDVLSVTTPEGPIVLFEENFENCSNTQFTAYNEASNKNWECTPMFGENNSGSYGINGYQEDVPSKDWLITKNKIDFDVEFGEKLSFYTTAEYGSNVLELVYSSNYDGIGNPSNFTWEAVPNISIPTHSTGSSTKEVYTFENIDISSINGTVYMAFKYYSNGEPTRWTVDSFEITAAINDDVDGDGVLNVDDLCPNTPSGESVDVNGCSNGQLDDDNDGVQNSDDLCAETPDGEAVNANGCSQSQLDDDNDGVMNNMDACPNTPNGESVNANGCSNGQLDDDNDGVQNSDDLCAGTPDGEEVNANGCSQSQLDDDNDGVMNNMDACPNTPNGESVNATGCSASELDDDNDGVMNNMDVCPNTSSGALVNNLGCFTLPANNFTVETTSETCQGKKNGQIAITGNASYDYTIKLNGNNFNYNSLPITGLEPGDYEVCLGVSGEDYEQCFMVNIAAGGTISAKAEVVSNKAMITVEEGTAPYTVFVNDVVKMTTSFSEFALDVKNGDVIKVKTSIDCEGKFLKTISNFNEITAYPNPTKGIFEIALNTTNEEVYVELFNMQSQLVLSNNYKVQHGKIQLNIAAYPVGIYMVKILLNQQPLILKLIKE